MLPSVRRTESSPEEHTPDFSTHVLGAPANVMWWSYLCHCLRESFKIGNLTAESVSTSSL